MREKIKINQSDAALWAAARDAWYEKAGDLPPPDALTLAAYLDGRLDAEGRERVETWMVGSDEALDFMLAARTAAAEAAPAAVVVRAQGLVGGPQHETRRAGGPVARLFAPLGDWFAGALQPAGWVASAAAALLLAAGAFELGRFGTQEIAAIESLLGQEIAANLPQTSDDFLL